MGPPVKTRSYHEADETAGIAFYRRLGYAVDEVVSMGKRMESDG
jgi:hypothetical protein